MSVYTSISGVVKKLDIFGTGIDGTRKSLSTLTTSIGGVNKLLYSKLDDSTVSKFFLGSCYYAYLKEGKWYSTTKAIFTSNYGNYYYSGESDGYKIYLKTKYPAASSTAEYDTGIRAGFTLYGLFKIADTYNALNTTTRFTTGSPFSFNLTNNTVTGNVGNSWVYYMANGNGSYTYFSPGTSVTINRLTHKDEFTAGWGNHSLTALYVTGRSVNISDYGTPIVKIPKTLKFNNVSYPLGLFGIDPLPT